MRLKKAKRRQRGMALLGVVLGFMFLISITSTPAYSQAVPKVLQKTIGEWSAIWWQWALSIPADSNPMLNGPCDEGQGGPVWFLAGSWLEGKATRDCAVPAGKYIFFPISNAFWVQTPLDNPALIEPDWRKLASDYVAPAAVMKCTLNGVPLIFNPDTPIVRSQSPVFTATFPEDNVFGMDPALLTGDPIVSDGYWVMLPPLPAGAYTLRFVADKKVPVQRRRAGPQDMTYHLLIGE
jgi:hypothetical protein